MRYVIWFSALLLWACQAATPASLPVSAPIQRQSTAAAVQIPQGGTLSGSFRLHPQLASRHVGPRRDVLVWLPPGYESQPQQRYPVLYMHDGNNLFDRRSSFGGSEWEVDERAGQLVRSGAIEPVIIVGIYNTSARMAEYTWHPMLLEGESQGGQGADYARFLVEELKPLIDQNYRTRPEREHTAVMGSSLGGLISFYIGLHHPETFSRIGMMSPSIWWKDRAILQDVSRLDPRLSVWLDMGTREGQRPEVMLQDAKDMAQALEKQGFAHFRNLAFHVEPDGTHSEAAWAARIERPLRFFYGR